ncbi:MAG: T9SS type A sorting domain-containing protein [Ignavibacteriae bacterium]|nr:T9SS type A sorting domain-containing protein [Ignavibacteriota bacterium]
MKPLKIFLSGLIIFLSSINLLGASITVSGPTSATMDPGTNTKTVRFNISYSPGGTPWTSSLHYKIDGGNRIPSNPDGSGANNPAYVDITLSQGNHTITFEWLAWDWAHSQWYYADTKTKNVTINFKVFAKNNFGSGSVKVDGASQTSGFYKLVKGGDNIGLEAIEQYYNSYNYIWNTSGTNNSDWGRIPYQSTRSPFSSNRVSTYSVISSDNNTTLEAGLRKICNINFANSFVGISYTSTIKVNGTNYNSPTSNFGVVEQNAISVTATNYLVQNYIGYLFDHWSVDGNTNAGRTIYPNSHNSYIAYYVGRPVNSQRNLHFNTSDPIGTPVKVMWNQHPNSYVSKYEIWRKITASGTPSKIATINRTSASTYTYTDNEIGISNINDKNHVVLYDVKSYYSLEGTLSPDDYYALYGELLAKDNPYYAETTTENTILENSIKSYPNPFNPTSTINYTIKEIGNVNITIYDALGRKVKELVNELKTPGSYEVKFDGSNLASGIYIYTMKVNNFFSSKKMILTK